jgi:hypothetical protein
VQLQNRQQSLASNLRVLRVQVRFLWNSHVARDLARTQMLDAGFPSGELGPAVISRIDGKPGDYCEKYLSSQRSAAL